MSRTAKLTLRQVQIIHRHGDRTPLFNVFRGAGEQEQQEVHRWSPMLPAPAQLAELNERFSVRKAAEAGQDTTYQTRPFGFLTDKGIQQLLDRGQEMRGICDPLGFERMKSSDIQIFSNSYKRTQLSVQALLTTLLTSELSHLAPRVDVLPSDKDMINTTAAYPEIGIQRLRVEQEDEELVEREHQLAACQAELRRLMPMFSNGVPFMWLAAADHFVCRDAHQIPLIPGSEELAPMAVQHLSFRFQKFYTSPVILSLVAGRMMRNVLQEMQRAMTGHEEQKKLVVYSGHDISVLSVLRTIGASIVDEDAWWPDYSTAITLELLEDEELQQWFVRARLNGKPMRSAFSKSSLFAIDSFGEFVSDRISGAPTTKL